MRFEIAGTVREPERVKAICRQVAHAAHVATPGLLVRVQNYHYEAKSGEFLDAEEQGHESMFFL